MNATSIVCPDVDRAAPNCEGGNGTEFSAAVESIASANIAEPALQPWRSAVQPTADPASLAGTPFGLGHPGDGCWRARVRRARCQGAGCAGGFARTGAAEE